LCGRRGVFLTLADTGTGMPLSTKAHLFEAFFTTKGIGGTGLGLWISADIMERHQGCVLLGSSQCEQHRGTVTAIFLPFGLSISDSRS
jgi:signal transduction histidine kinase